MASDDGRRAGFALAAIHFALAGCILTVGLNIISRLDADAAARRTITVKALKEDPMSFSECWMSGNTRVVVSTEQGTFTTRIVDADDNIPANESPQAASDRHDARVAEAKRIKPKTGDC